MIIGHEVIEPNAGSRIHVTVSRDAYVLPLLDDAYRKYLKLEPLPSAFAILVTPPSGTLVAYGAGRVNILVWPVADREPEWQEDFTYRVTVAE